MCFRLKHRNNILLERVLGVLPLLLEVVNVLELVQVASVLLEVDHIELLFHDGFGLFL